MDQPQDATKHSSQPAPQPILRLEKCLIRPHCGPDAEALSRNANNAKIAKWMSNLWPYPYTIKDAREWIDLSMSLSPTRTFVICCLDGTPIGGVGLKTDVNIQDAARVELGYWLGEDHWGKGIATEVAIAFSKWTFERFENVQQIDGEVFGGNDRSGRVLEKAGYVFQETRKDGFKKGDVFLDVLVYSMSRPRPLRILFLHPAPPTQERIDVSLLQFRLGGPELVFSALSYTWQTSDKAQNGGGRHAPMQVLCDDAVLDVSANCHAFLRRLRHPGDSIRVWWADAVCIDQSNVEERSAQVSLMRRIYSQADTVVVWLGDTSPETDLETSLPLSDLGMKFIYDFAAEITERTSAGLDGGGGALYQELIRERTAFRGKGTGEALTPRVRGLWEILRRPWWNRLWTIQELTLAKEVILTLGVEYQSFGNLRIVIEAMMRDGQAPEELEYNRSLLAPASHMFVMCDYLERARDAPCRAPGEKALDVLSNTRHAVATDPRDKIYGILGFFGDRGSDPHNIFPAPDYKKKVAELYSDVSRSIITSTRSLDVLNSCHAFLESSIPGLPSWAAAWNDTPLGYYNLKTFNTAGGSRFVYEHSDEHRFLKIKGRKLGRVKQMRGPYDGMAYSDKGCVFLWYFWHKYATSSWPPHATGGRTEDVLLNTLCWGNDMVGERLAPGDYREAFDAWQEILQSKGPIGPENLESVAKRILEDEVAFKFSRRAWFVMIGRALGVTEKPYLAMLPVGVDVGDELVILSGGRVPFVVRAEGDNYKLMGACYVHGIMDGEAFETEASGSDALEWFTLC